MTTADAQPAYRIEDLSRLSGTTVRTIRAYTDRGLLPRPDRSGRANVYDDAHLARLRQIADLLERGYTLASIKELLAAWDAGTGLGGVLGLVGEVDRPWSDERPARISLDELTEAFGGVTDLTAVQEALQPGGLEPVPGEPEEFLVPSPQELAVAVELHTAGVPLSAITGHLREVRIQVEHISERFLEFTTEYVLPRFLQHPPTDEAEEEAGLVRRLRPLAQQTVDAELARAMRTRASAHVRRHRGEAGLTSPTTGGRSIEPGGDAPGVRDAGDTGSGEPGSAAGSPAGPADGPAAEVLLPSGTVDAVRALVGDAQVAAFVAAATDREVAARRMDALAGGAPSAARDD